MAAALIPRKTYSEIYTATREAEQKLLEAENGLDTQLRRLHDQLAPPTVAHIKKVSFLGGPPRPFWKGRFGLVPLWLVGCG